MSCLVFFICSASSYWPSLPSALQWSWHNRGGGHLKKSRERMHTVHNIILSAVSRTIILHYGVLVGLLPRQRSHYPGPDYWLASSSIRTMGLHCINVDSTIVDYHAYFLICSCYQSYNHQRKLQLWLLHVGIGPCVANVQTNQRPRLSAWWARQPMRSLHLHTYVCNARTDLNVWPEWQ